jgi:hypothetical protein
MALLPEDLAALSHSEEDWKRNLPLLRERYAANRRTDDYETLEEFIEKKDPDHMAIWRGLR